MSAEPSLSGPGRGDLSDLLWRLGIRTIGEFAALPRTDVASRFGADAVVAHRFARGEPDRGPCGRELPAELEAVLHCEPPIERVDAAAFAGRTLAAALHRSLEAAGVGCTRLAIHAVTAAGGQERSDRGISPGGELSRVWRCAEPLTEDATADRVRWQLDGWLTSRRISGAGGLTGPVTILRLQPVEVVSAEALQLPLWGGLGEDGRLRAGRALVRVQGLLGQEAVQVPVKPSKAEKLANPNAPPTFTTEYRPRKERTKFATLLQDLVDLRKQEPAFHAVVFTRFDQTHAHLVRLIHDESTRESGALYAGKSKAVKIFEFSKATAPTARAGAGYLQIVNKGDQPDRLIGVTAGFPRVMIHTTQMDGDIARMVHLEAVDIPAGETVTFAPGGLHVMFMGLNGDPFETGESFDAVLVFEAAGEVPVTFYVEDISDLTDHSHH